jgi:hypothetical protein
LAKALEVVNCSDLETVILVCCRGLRAAVTQKKGATFVAPKVRENVVPRTMIDARFGR